MAGTEHRRDQGTGQEGSEGCAEGRKGQNDGGQCEGKARRHIHDTGGAGSAGMGGGRG